MRTLTELLLAPCRHVIRAVRCVRALETTLACLLALVPDLGNAQTDLQRAQNVATCLAGKFPTQCKREWLTVEEARTADIAERQENLRVRLTGRYSSFCRKDKLSAKELEQVLLAEKKENRRVCLTGRYKALCNKGLLSEAERKEVLLAERKENARVCLSGLYPMLCDKSLLTQEKLLQTTAAERRAAENKGKPAETRKGTGRAGFSTCEVGDWIESVASDGRIIKLEDGSIWEVDPVDAIDSALWLPLSDLVVCGNKLINTDDNETVSARKLR